MTEKLNCSTCTIPKNVTYPKWCPVIEEWVAPNYPEKTFILRKCGCLSHSGAREWLMAPAIAELECKAMGADAEGDYVAVAIYEDAIALTRDGVNHERTTR